MMNTPSSQLLAKYNIAGPRYTSYPTVPYWDCNPTQQKWIQELRQSLDQNLSQSIGASLYLHIPFCKSLCTYCGCNTRITRKTDVADPYVTDLLTEWQLYRQALGIDRPLATSEIHLGGGTPTFLRPQELSRLMEELFKTLRIEDSAELSLEADPRTTTPEQLAVLREFGFRRLSLGIQDFDPRVQEAVNRIQSVEQVREITEAARAMGYTSVNFDLIYGLPFQTLTSIESTVKEVNQLRPDRIAFYGYAHVPWIKPGQRRFTEADLPDGDTKRQLYELGRTLFEGSGYHEVGMDHFSLEGDSLWKSVESGTLHRNFMGYTPRFVAPQFGLGVSSIGDAGTCFAQNEKLLETYQKRVREGEIPLHRGHVLTEEDRIIRQQILNIMTRLNTSWEPHPFLDGVPSRLSELERDGLVVLGERSCEVTPLGRAFLRNISMAFDARLIAKAPTTKLFSQTV